MTAIDPSSAYDAGWSPIWYATVVSMPCLDRTISCPVCISRNEPVPYVHFASPALKQVCPNSAAC